MPPADWLENEDPAFDSTDISSLSLKIEDTVKIWATTSFTAIKRHKISVLDKTIENVQTPS